MAKNTSTSYGLVVSLSDSEANAITMAQPAGQSAADKLSLTAGSLLRDLAKGGVMIGPEWATRIEAAIETTDPSAIVDHVERSVRRKGDATRIEWVVDPTQVQYYQMLADNAGVSLEHELKSMLDFAYEQGWFGSAAPDAFKILLTPEQYRYLQGLFEKDIVTGADVIDQLKADAGRVLAPEENDFILDALKER